MSRTRSPVILGTLALVCCATAAGLARGGTLRPGLVDGAVGLAVALTFVAALGTVALGAASVRIGRLRAMAVALTLGALLTLAELPALFGYVDYGHLWSVASGEWRGPATSFVSHPVLAWARPPHRSWEGRPRSDMAVAFNLPVRAPREQSFTTDAKGFRNRLDRSHADIALVGDSYVEGAYVSDDETAASGLERLTGWSVANLGRSGYGTLQELEVVRLFALPLHPRAVAWFFFEGNDLYDDDTYENALAYLHEHGRYAAAQHHALGWSRFSQASLSLNAARLLRRTLDPIVPVGAPSYGLFHGPRGPDVKLYFYKDAALRFDDYEVQRLAKARRALSEGAALLRANGIALQVVFVPSKFRVYHDRCQFPGGSPCGSWSLWDLEARFQELCSKDGLPLLDLTGPMRAAAGRGEILYAPEDSHWNAEGHRFVAGLLATALRLGNVAAETPHTGGNLLSDAYAVTSPSESPPVITIAAVRGS